ncbi:hypothetical protein KAI87_13130, partial [Myxococcota bacterium]|nr:hypothetical protein [Myxococcota bacterium]
EPILFDGYSLRFPQINRGADIRVYKNPGHTILWLAFLFFIVALLWRLLFPTRRIWIFFSDEGTKAQIKGDAFDRDRVFEDTKALGKINA